MRKSFNGLSGIVTNGMCASLRSGDTARRLIGGYRGAVQTDGYEVYESFEGAPGKMMIGCWAHDVEIRPWLEDTLRRLPTEKDITVLLPENWQPVTAK